MFFFERFYYEFEWIFDVYGIVVLEVNKYWFVFVWIID